MKMKFEIIVFPLNLPNFTDLMDIYIFCKLINLVDETRLGSDDEAAVVIRR